MSVNHEKRRKKTGFVVPIGESYGVRGEIKDSTKKPHRKERQMSFGRK